MAQAISSPLDLLIVDINTGKPVLALGQGKLITNQVIAGTLAQALCLFSDKVVQETISFVNFSEHVIFFSGKGRYRAVTLIPSYMNLIEISLKMELVLQAFRAYLGRTSTLDPAIGPDIYGFWISMLSPENTIFVAPRTAEGFLAYLVLLMGIVRDLKSSAIEQIVDNTFFLTHEERAQIPNLVNKKKAKSVITVAFSRSQIPDLSPLPLCILAGDDIPTTPFPKLEAEKHTDSIARIFGSDSKAWVTAATLGSDEAFEVAKTVQTIPSSHDTVIKEAITNVLQSPDDEILISLSETFLTFMKTFTRSIPEIPLEPTPSTPSEVPLEHISPPTSVLPPESGSISESEIPPDLFPSPTPESMLETISPPPLDLAKELIPTIPFEAIPPKIPPRAIAIGDNDYIFNVGPIVLLTEEFVKTTPNPAMGTQFRGKIEIRVGTPKEENLVDISVILPPDRAPNFSEEIKPDLYNIPGSITVQNDATIIPVPISSLKKYIRAISWLVCIEYLIEIKKGIMEKSKSFEFPPKGSIMLIPPGRDFQKRKLPKQIAEVLKEKDIRDTTETDQPWSAGASVDKIILEIVKHLKSGNGVAFIPHPVENEMSEITLFSLLTSEITGIAFSRW
ncbi:MAG: hypothetical protein ACFFCQ_11765 [Promethearchaeota archaeon]